MESWNNSVNRAVPYVGDAGHASREDMHELALRGIYALLDVPIYIDDRWWGTIGIDDMARTREWSNAEIDGLVITANLLGAAIKRQQVDATLQSELQKRKALINELEVRNAESETLRKSVAIVAATLEQSEAIERILEQLKQVLPFDSASVQLLNGDMLEIVSERGGRESEQKIFPVDENEPAYPVIHGKIPYVLYEDIQFSVPSFNDIPHNNIRAWMAIPLKVRGRIIGIIALDGYRIGQFSARDAELALSYADQVAIALENARLFTELQAELSLRQKLINELESKNAELERFTYTVSHDLRSPLVTIRGFLGYMERYASQGDMDGFRRDMQRVSSATDRMDSLLKDVLELSRVGRIVSQPQEIPFEDLIREAQEIVHGRIQRHATTIQIQPGLPAVFGDRMRLLEVMQNLLDNAAKYTGNQKKPVIQIGMDGSDLSGMPVFFVRDNGMGIDPQYHDRIFGMFNKLDPDSEGTGIGLALVKRIIEFHGGRIWVESEAAKGTTFYFTLPANPRSNS
jgi:signal transduction histidine kinase